MLSEDTSHIKKERERKSERETGPTANLHTDLGTGDRNLEQNQTKGQRYT